MGKDHCRYGWSKVWLFWIQGFQYIQITKYFIVWSNSIQLSWRQADSNPSPYLWWVFFFLKKWAIPGLSFFIFVFSIQLTVNVQYQFLPMSGFERQTSGIESDSSTNWATTTVLVSVLWLSRWCCICGRKAFASFSLLSKVLSCVF